MAVRHNADSTWTGLWVHGSDIRGLVDCGSDMPLTAQFFEDTSADVFVASVVVIIVLVIVCPEYSGPVVPPIDRSFRA